ncbi:UNVERIFIED_CONTAM: hypothetical protein GTU68_063270 [Idotea baltica]|nr:hypothetical protein [Idotea baltica]
MVQAGGVNSGGGGREGDRFAVNSPLDTNPFALAPHDVIEAAAKAICDELLDDAILNITFEVHRSMKRGLLSLEAGLPEDESRFYQVNAEGLDVFGQAPVKKQHECVCPNCSRNLAASRFAPHLEKCMGMGRNSSRIASRRIQNSTRESNSHLLVGHGSDDDDDDDWYVDRKRRKRDKNSPRRSRAPKVNFQICGVVSEHTGKMCTRSIRCPQHSMEQRRAVRDQLLGMGDIGLGINSTTTRAADSTTNISSKYSVLDNEDVQVGRIVHGASNIVWSNYFSDLELVYGSIFTMDCSWKSILYALQEVGDFISFFV